MDKVKYLMIIVALAFSLVFWSSSSFGQEWVEGTVQSYYQPRGWETSEASWLIGHMVYSPAGGYLGQISDFLIDKADGHVALVIFSDVPWYGDRYVAAPLGALERTGEHTFQISFGDREIAVTETYRDPYAYELERYASTVGLSDIPSAIDPFWAETVYRFYGQTPYWTEEKGDIMSYQVARSMSFAGLIFEEETGHALIGSMVQSADGEANARISDLVIDCKDGRVALLVLDQVPGRGDAMVAAPFGGLSMSGDAYVLNTTGDKLASAPSFGSADLDNQRMAADIYTYFGMQPYWTEGR
jgi:hypothetical protein